MIAPFALDHILPRNKNLTEASRIETGTGCGDVDRRDNTGLANHEIVRARVAKGHGLGHQNKFIQTPAENVSSN